MAIQRWDPLRDLVSLQEKIKQLFDDTLSRSSGQGDADLVVRDGWRPPLDLFEETGQYVVRADLPGIDSADVELRVEDGTLVIRGERKADAEVARDSYLRVERPQGAFSAQIALPPSVDATAIHATQKNGVIEISLPKKEASAPNRIPISSGP
ncbi:MAG: Hsp20/alpha crystallin family protein [bacterium]|nr:Hsp20/alpha crystallin family protein [bacterium]